MAGGALPLAGGGPYLDCRCNKKGLPCNSKLQIASPVSPVRQTQPAALGAVTLDQLYGVKQGLLNKLGVDRFLGFLLSKGITPNKLTTISLGFSALAVVFVFRHPLAFSFCVVQRFLLDGLDGYFARRFNLQTVLGHRLDHWGDLGFSVALLGSAVISSDFPILASLSLLVYVGEYWLLRAENLLARKFPSGVFIFFFVGGLYGPGLTYQILYQVGSYLYFRFVIKTREAQAQ